MSIESPFRDLYNQALQLVEERDVQISALLKLCAVPLRGEVANHNAIRSSYKSAKRVVDELALMEQRLVRKQVTRDRNLEWNLNHQALISALQVKRYGLLLKRLRMAFLARKMNPVNNPDFLILFEEALKCAEESDVQQRLMMADCNSYPRFETVEYCYRESEKAIGRISVIVNKLHRLHTPKEENRELHNFQRWLITALQSYRYVHIMELWRQTLMRQQLGLKLGPLEPLPDEL
jgi:hypothetical protein